MFQTAVDDAPVDPVEIVLGDQESVVLRLDLEVGIDELDESALIELHGNERTTSNWLPEVEQRGE